MFIGVPAMYRMMDEAGAEHRDLTSIRVWGSGADAMPGRPGPPVQEDGRQRDAARSSARSARPRSSRATAWSRSAAGVAAKVSPPMLDVGLGESIGFQLPSYQFRVVDDEGAEVRTGATGELWVRGPGRDQGLLERARDQRPHRDRRRLAAHRRPRPQGPARHRAVRRSPEGRDQARRLLGVRGRGAGGARAPPRRARGRGRRACPTSARARSRPPSCAWSTAPTSTDLDLEAWASEHLSRYKVPRRFVAVDELPRTGTNKVQKQELLALF